MSTAFTLRAARRRSRPRLGVAVLAATAAAASLTSGTAFAEAPPDIRTIEGELPDGATYLIEVPADWNGTLSLFGHGMRFPGEPNPPEITASDGSRNALLNAGIALAASSYATTGWATEAVDDQLATLEVFREQVGEPTRTIAWGESLGGMVSLQLAEQHADVIDAAMPVCGPLAGGAALWNSYLDAEFVLTTLVGGPNAPLLVDIDDPVANVQAAIKMLKAADDTAQGRARIALAAAVMQMPGRIDPFETPGTPSTIASRTAARIQGIEDAFTFLAFGERAELESRAGGNPSTNIGVDYEHLLALSAQDADVRAVYTAAGLDLSGDLATLKRAPRIAADPAAAAFLTETSSFTGTLTVPVLTMHTVDDGQLPSSHERAYGELVRTQGDTALLRPLFVDRAGHCTVTSAELVTGLQALERRLDTGRWSGLRPAELNAAATALGPALSMVIGTLVPPAFTSHLPLPFPRAGSAVSAPVA